MEEQRRYTRRRFKIWHGIVGVLLLLFILFHVTGSLKLKKQLKILKAKGYPITFEELESWYNLPAGSENSADVYMDAFANYVEWDKEDLRALPVIGRAPLPARTEPLDDPNQQLAEKFLSDNRKTLTLLYKAATIDNCRYPIGFIKEPDTDDSWLKSLRNCTRLLSLDFLIQCENKDSEKAIESIHTNLSLANSSNVPIIIHRLIQIAVRAQTYRDIERLLNRTQLTEEQLKRLSVWLEAPDNNEEYKRILIGENCIGLQAFRGNVREVSGRLGSEGGLSTIFLAFWRITGLNNRNAAEYLKMTQEYIDAMELPSNKRLLVFESIQKDVDSGKRGGMLTRILTPALGRIMQIETRHLAHLLATQTALAIERYRLAEGHLPESLENLVPTYMELVPKDPFDGRDLRYITREKGFVVYSVNEDLTDQGGAERDGRKRGPNNKLLPWDVTCIVER